MTQMIDAKTLTPEQQASIVDVRTPDEFWQEHIPGSKNVPLDKLSQHMEALSNQELLILSCRSGKRAQEASTQLQNAGIGNIVLLQNGLEGWKQAKRPTNRQHGGPSVMQQTQLVIGAMILTGLSVPVLWFLPYIAGLGLLVAGLTNTCMLAKLISAMPWNKMTPGSSQCSVS